jgi:hypothetical protein
MGAFGGAAKGLKIASGRVEELAFPAYLFGVNGERSPSSNFPICSRS